MSMPAEDVRGVAGILLNVASPSLNGSTLLFNDLDTAPRSMGTIIYAQTEQHSRTKSRIECVVGDQHATTVVDTILKEGGERTFAYVVAVESAHPVDTIKI